MDDAQSKQRITVRSGNTGGATQNNQTSKSAVSGEEIADFLAHSRDKDNVVVPEKTDKKTRKRKEKKAHQATNKRRLKRFALIALAVLILGGLLFFIFRPHFSQLLLDGAKDDALESDKIYYSALTGLEVEKAEITNSATTCIMIENSPDARPQSGLAEAGVVYEAVAEGGITRFMAIFQEAKPQFIGPVRSLRITYAEMAKPYHCSIAHVGGADNALGLVRGNNGFRDIDQFYNADSYWREGRAIAGKRRFAPHNVYTSFERLDALNFRRGYNTSEFHGFSRVSPDAPPAEVERNATTINIKMSSSLYDPIFTYNPDTNTYTRAHANGGPHLSVTADGKSHNITPTVVIAMKVNGYTRPGPDHYTDYTTTGENEAFVFQNGSVTIGKWKRDNADAELQFYDGDGNIIKLNRGQTWLSLYPSGVGAVHWQ